RRCMAAPGWRRRSWKGRWSRRPGRRCGRPRRWRAVAARRRRGWSGSWWRSTRRRGRARDGPSARPAASWWPGGRRTGPSCRSGGAVWRHPAGGAGAGRGGGRGGRAGAVDGRGAGGLSRRGAGAAGADRGGGRPAGGDGRGTALRLGLRHRGGRAGAGPGLRADLEALYGGTRLAAQELEGAVVEAAGPALWTAEALAGCRGEAPARLERIVVAVDPPAGTGEGRPFGSACGIVVAGRAQDRAFV